MQQRRPVLAKLGTLAVAVALAVPPLAAASAAEGGGVQSLCFGRLKERVEVGSADELRRALEDAKCGTEVVLAPGTYEGEFTARGQCSADRPLVVRAAEPQKATLAGTLKTQGRYVVVAGLEVDGGQILVTGDSTRVTRNRFLTGGNSLTLRGGGSGNRVDHNEVATPGGAGIDVALKLSGNDKRQARDNLIDHNLFRSRGGGRDGAGDEDDDGERRPSVGLYLGQFSARKGRDQMIEYGRINTVVEQNLFLDFRKQNAIHIKSLGNIVRGNSFVDSNATAKVSKVTVRSGQFNEIVANYMDGTTGLRIFEEKNRALRNVMRNGAELAVMSGGGETTQFGGPQQRQAAETLVAGNSGPLKIGRRNPGDRGKRPAEGTVVEAHNGPVERDLEEGTVVRASTTVPSIPARKLGPDDVGLAAPDPRCAPPTQ